MYKYLMEKAMTMTFTEFKEFYEGFKKRNPKLFKGGKDLKTLILKNVKTGRYHKVRASEEVELKVGYLMNYWDFENPETTEVCEVVKIIDKVKKKRGVVFSEFANMPAAWRIPEYMKPMLKSFGKPPGCVIEFKSTRMGKNYIYRLYEEIKKEKEKERKEKEELSRLRKRPYFVTRVDILKGEPEGKENLNKIEFPCYCSFKFNTEERFGQLNKGFDGDTLYELHDISEQTTRYNRVDSNRSLKKLMQYWCIEILKGETRLWKVVR